MKHTISISFDLIILGSGSADLVAAKMARGLGKSVALIEQTAALGVCTWTGCIPSKTLMYVASLLRSRTFTKPCISPSRPAAIYRTAIIEFIRANREVITGSVPGAHSDDTTTKSPIYISQSMRIPLNQKLSGISLKKHTSRYYTLTHYYDSLTVMENPNEHHIKTAHHSRA